MSSESDYSQTARHLLLARVALALVMGLLPWAVPTALAEAPGTFSPTGAPGTVYDEDATFTLLPDGRVLAMEGSFSKIYNPTTGTWTTTAGATTIDRVKHTATLLPTGKVLIAGGNDNTGTGASTNSAELFDPTAGNFTAIADILGTARSLHTATLLPTGKVLIVGGRNFNAQGGGTNLFSAELYDPVAGTFEDAPGATAGQARHSHTTTLLPNGKVLIVGGQTSTGLGGAQLYDPVAGTVANTSGAMGTNRMGHTATLLPNGKVLIAGGVASLGGPALASAELYDPVADNFTAIATSMTNARTGHAASLLANGKVLLAGGGQVSAELYDPTTQTFSSTDDLGAARTGHEAIALGTGRVLIAGGGFDSAELYCPEMTGTPGTWTATGNMGTVRFGHSATLLPTGKVLVAGGSADGGNTGLASAELYDPQLGTWSSTGSMATGRYHHTATLLPNGKVLVTGGWNGFNVGSAELYDPKTGTWSSAGAMGQARSEHRAVLLPNGKVLVSGGSLGAGVPTASAELYDPQTNTWSSTGSLAQARYEHTAALLPTGKVLAAAGWGGAGPAFLASAELYDHQTGTWSSTGSLIIARISHATILLPNGKVLLAGGSVSGGTTASAELYDPQTGTWSSTGSLAQARSNIQYGTVLLPNGKALVAGGEASSFPNRAELYDFSVGTWVTTSPITSATARGNLTATLLANGQVVAAGGWDSTTAGQLASAELYSTTICGPEIASISQTSASAGSAITITGGGFGATQGSSAVTVGGVPASILSWSDNEIVALVPTTAPASSSVAVNVGGTASNAAALTVVPTIASLTVTPPNPTIGVGQTQQFTATATFTDGTTLIMSGGTPVGVAIIAGANRVVFVDPDTGSLIPITALVGPTDVSAGVLTLDVQGNRGYLSHGGNLITLDTQTDTVLSTVAMPASVSSLEFESTTGRLLGIALIGTSNNLVTVNPATGALTAIGSGTPGLPFVSAGVSAIDPTTNSYFVTAGGSLVTFNTQTGAATLSPPFTLSPGGTVVGGVSSLEFHPVSGLLLGMALVSGVNTLVVVNPISGTLTPLGPGLPGLPAVSAGVAALDLSANRYFVSMGGQLVAFDTTTGNVLSSVPFAGVSSLVVAPPWRSSIPIVATITQAGLATGVSGGTSTITASAFGVEGSTLLTVTAPSDFTLAASPGTQTVVRGGSTTYTVTLGSLNGFNSAVTLSITTGLPSGTIATFNPNPVTPSGTSTLTITTTGSTPTGTFPAVTIQGTGGSQMHLTSVTLVVLALGITPATATVPVGGQLTFGGVGGTPPYFFSVVSGGGSINANTGVYTAAGTPGTVTVQVTDSAAGTPNTAEATVTVVAGAGQVAVSLDGRALGLSPTMTIAPQGGGAALYTGLTTDRVQELLLAPSTSYTLTAGAVSLNFTVTGQCAVTLQ